MRDQRGGRRVADAHFAEADQVAAVHGQVAAELAAARDGRGALFGRHRRFFKIVGRAGCHLGVEQAGPLAEIVRNAGIDDRQMQLVLARKDIDRGAAGEEILDHLPGHVLRIGRDAGLGRAMVAGEDQHVGLVEIRVETLLDQADLFGHRFELTERAARLGLLVDLVLQRSGQPLVGGNDVEF